MITKSITLKFYTPVKNVCESHITEICLIFCRRKRTSTLTHCWLHFFIHLIYYLFSLFNKYRFTRQNRIYVLTYYLSRVFYQLHSTAVQMAACSLLWSMMNVAYPSDLYEGERNGGRCAMYSFWVDRTERSIHGTPSHQYKHCGKKLQLTLTSRKII